MSEALVIGLSHSAAIAEALEATGGGEAVTVKRLESRNRPYERDTISIEQALDTVAGLPDRAAVFLAMLGTCHNHLGLLRSGPDFDFLVGPGDSPEPGAQERVPQRAIASAFEEYLKSARTIEKIRAVSSVPVILLSAPPPKESSRFMLDYLLRRAKREKYGRSVERAGVERADSRLKMWFLESRVTARWAQDRDIVFLPAPEKCFNSEGFLARKYYANDATHANAAYGALVLEQIRSTVKELNRVASNG